MYEYSVRVTEVVDGDTVHAAVDLGFDQWCNKTLRLYGINAPELPTDEGERAKAFLENYAPRVTKVRTYKDRREKYGRYLATLYTDGGEDVNQAVLDSGNAVSYLPK